MKVRSAFAWGLGAVAGGSILATGWFYRNWMQRQRQRLVSESHLIETALGTIEYQKEGDGPPILVLHGSPGGYDQGMAMGRLLNLSSYTLLAPSRPGYRRTPLSSGQTPEKQADLFAATLDALNIAQVVIVALSGGGPSALQFALRYPDHCRGIVMISSLSQAYTEEAIYSSLPLGQRLLKRLTDRAMVWNPLLFVVSSLSRRMPQEGRATEFIGSLVMNSLHSDGYLNDMQQFALLPAYPLQDIVHPTLIIHGTADIDVPFRQAQDLANGIPHAQLMAIEGSDHFSALSDKAIIAVHDFLQTLPAYEDAAKYSQ